MIARWSGPDPGLVTMTPAGHGPNSASGSHGFHRKVNKIILTTNVCSTVPVGGLAGFVRSKCGRPRRWRRLAHASGLFRDGGGEGAQWNWWAAGVLGDGGASRAGQRQADPSREALPAGPWGNRSWREQALGPQWGGQGGRVGPCHRDGEFDGRTNETLGKSRGPSRHPHTQDTQCLTET